MCIICGVVFVRKGMPYVFTGVCSGTGNLVCLRIRIMHIRMYYTSLYVIHTHEYIVWNTYLQVAALHLVSYVLICLVCCISLIRVLPGKVHAMYK